MAKDDLPLPSASSHSFRQRWTWNCGYFTSIFLPELRMKNHVNVNIALLLIGILKKQGIFLFFFNYDWLTESYSSNGGFPCILVWRNLFSSVPLLFLVFRGINNDRPFHLCCCWCQLSCYNPLMHD